LEQRNRDETPQEGVFPAVTEVKGNGQWVVWVVGLGSAMDRVKLGWADVAQIPPILASSIRVSQRGTRSESLEPDSRPLLAYVGWREKHGGGRNSAALELRIFGLVVDEAIRRQMTERNPARNLRIKQTPPKEKSVWNDAELATVDTALVAPRTKYGWMRASFLLGRFQASRLGQSVVPLSAIDLQRSVIHWPFIGHEGW